MHAATLPDGREVVVKVLRPGMREAIDLDLEVLHALAGLAEEYWPESRRLRPREVVVEYEKTILNELDLMREAGNASQLKRNFAGSPLLHVPEVYWDLCRQDVMVMERIRGIQISEVARLRELGTDIPKLAENGVEIFFTQVFRHNFFHADMHPGNIFVDVADPANPRYAAVDFGIIGTLEPRDQLYLAGNFLAFFERDYRRVAVLHLESGWVPAGTRVDELESAVRTVCEPIFDKPLKDISFGIVLMHLFEVARRYEMQVQPQLILLQKTLLNIEGLGRQLYPELDLWKTALPILRDWMRERASPRTVIGSLREHWPDIAEAIKVLPVIARRAIRRAYDDELVVRTESASLEALREEHAEAAPAQRRHLRRRRRVPRRHRLDLARHAARLARLGARRRRRRLARSRGSLDAERDPLRSLADLDARDLAHRLDVDDRHRVILGIRDVGELALGVADDPVRAAADRRRALQREVRQRIDRRVVRDRRDRDQVPAVAGHREPVVVGVRPGAARLRGWPAARPGRRRPPGRPDLSSAGSSTRFTKEPSAMRRTSKPCRRESW